MTINEIKKELNLAFGKYEFIEDGHYYLCNGKRVGISVTKFISQYENEFDSQTIATMVANKENKTVDEVLAEWKYKADFACEKGTACHEWSQSLWSDEEWNLLPFDKTLKYIEAVDKIKQQAINFKNDYQDILVHIKDELLVGSEEFDIASAVDHLFYNKFTDKIVLVDYKTNSVLKGYNDDGKNARYTKKMKVPLQHLDDLALYHYHIQLSIYKYLIEKYTDLIVDEWFIVYMSENNDNYEIIETPYLKDEVEKILEMRRVKNMNSVPVLIYGKSGTGKSTSLRNFKKDEVAVINVLNKPLPFRSDLKAVAIDDYATIIRAIKATKKKVVVIDDAGYLLSNEAIKRGKEVGYTKFTDMAMKFFTLIEEIRNLDGGKTVYIMLHEELDELGNAKLKLTGKMLDQQVCIEGCFTIALRAMCSDGKYIFRVHNNGQDITKSPFDMFEQDEVDNDLKEVDKVIREYYELDKVEVKEDKKEEEK